MRNFLTINEASKQVGLPEKTIRYYEESGVVSSLQRGDNNYRQFSNRDIKRLKLIKQARDLGLPLSEIKQIVSECIDKGCVEARRYASNNFPDYIKEIDRKLSEFQELKSELISIQSNIHKEGDEWIHGSDDCCKILPNFKVNRRDK